MGFFRWTDKQLALIPEEIEVKKTQQWKLVRKSIWSQIYDLIMNGKISADEFENWSLHELKHWRAPRCPESQRTWSKIADHKYHIHHKNPRHRWWDNDKKNLVITTPLYHDTTLSPTVHYWKYYAKKREEKKTKR